MKIKHILYIQTVLYKGYFLSGKLRNKYLEIFHIPDILISKVDDKLIKVICDSVTLILKS